MSERVAKLVALGAVVATAIASLARRPTAKPMGMLSLRLGYDPATLSVVARVGVVATRGATPITAEITCSLDGMKQSKTITITELNKEYTVEFRFSVPAEGQTVTVTVSGVLRNPYGEYSLPPTSRSLTLPAPPEGRITRLEVYYETGA